MPSTSNACNKASRSPGRRPTCPGTFAKCTCGIPMGMCSESARVSRRNSVLYLVLEDFKGDPIPVYRRFRDQGRLAPEGLRYVSSWVTTDFMRCYQIMDCDDPALLQQWIERWKDFVDFEVIPVITSADAAAALAPRL